MIQVLLLTGENNHDWARSAPFVKGILEASGKFQVDLVTDASAALEDAEGLKRYQVLFMDYNGPEWSATAKANFTAAISGGTGLVVLHAADNAFTGWVEFEQMVGLLWREGTGHGEFHEFKVDIVDHYHPITRQFNSFTLWDELYHRLVHLHDVPVRVLAAAYSDPAKGGTSRHEPMMVVTQYGQGRVFHSVLGHVWPGDPNGEYKGATMITFENPGFQRNLLRGTEWAATGDVIEE